MNLNNRILIGIGILGIFAAIYMIISNIFYNKDYSFIAIVSGLLSPLYSYVSWNRGKSK